MHQDITSVLQTLQKKFKTITYVSTLKSGKEATVHIVEVNGKLHALKVYKNQQKYSSRGEYLLLSEISSRTLRSAVRNKSRKGRGLLQELWTFREYDMMRKLYKRNASIPKVLAFTNEAILMEYLGTSKVPAPRLVDITLTKDEAEFCFQEVIRNLELFLDFRIVHGDFSEFNILWYEKKPYIIDFPQVLHLDSNPNAEEKFLKDLENVKRYFGKYGIKNVEKETNELYEVFLRKKYYG
jgi:RIO kinase 1